jgi:hypothetical protein
MVGMEALIMGDEAEICRGWGSEKPTGLRDSCELPYYDPRGLIVVAFVPPQTALDPPAVFTLVIEQCSAPAAYVVFEFYLRILLHIHLDCANRLLVP